MRASDLEPSP